MLLPAAGLASAAHATDVVEPNDPLFKHQWNLEAIQIPEAWDVTRGAGSTVAVLDTGVAYEDRGPYRRAPDLAGTRFVRGWDFIDDDAQPDDEPPPDGDQSHGTHMAGVIGQTTDNRIGGAGAAPMAAIMPIRVLEAEGEGSPEAIAKGLRFAADNGADVANVSIAGPSRSRVLQDAIGYAYARGVTIVAAAGNLGRPSVSFPASNPKVIAVGAVGRSARRRAYYSNYGEALDLVAPGGDGELDQTGYGDDDGVLAQTLKGGPSTFCYCFKSSTSGAAAEVSAAAALLVASGRATSPAQIREALLASAKDLGRPGRDAEHGAGLLQVSSALATGGERADPSGRPRLVWLALSVAAAALAAIAALGLARRKRPSVEG